MAQSSKDITKYLNKETILITTLLVIGAGLVIFFGGRMVSFYLRVYNEGLEFGTTDVEAIRPWMTVRYVAVAYAVPEEYIFYGLDIPADARNHDDTLRDLNRAYHFGPPPTEGAPPPIIEKVQAILTQYQENPVTTKLKEIEPWMTIHYISNATGVPQDYIFAELDIPIEDNANKPIAEFRGMLHLKGKGKSELGLIEVIVRKYQVAQGDVGPEIIHLRLTIQDIATIFNMPESYLYQHLNIPAQHPADMPLGDLIYWDVFENEKALIQAIQKRVGEYQLENPPSWEDNDG